MSQVNEGSSPLEQFNHLINCTGKDPAPTKQQASDVFDILRVGIRLPRKGKSGRKGARGNWKQSWKNRGCTTSVPDSWKQNPDTETAIGQK